MSRQDILYIIYSRQSVGLNAQKHAEDGHNGRSLSLIITLSLILRADNTCHVTLFALDECGRERQTRLVDACTCFSVRPLEMV